MVYDWIMINRRIIDKFVIYLWLINGWLIYYSIIIDWWLMNYWMIDNWQLLDDVLKIDDWLVND